MGRPKRKKSAEPAATMTTLAASVRSGSAAPVTTSYSRRTAPTSLAGGLVAGPGNTTAKSSMPGSDNCSREQMQPDLVSARHEVFQLGLEGMSRARRRDTLVQKLVLLGAKPPARTATNYRELMETAKQRREAERREKETLRKSGLALPTLGSLKQLKFKRPRNKNKVRGFDGQPGRFKKGVQIVPRRVRKS